MNSGFSGADFEEARKEEIKNTPLVAADPVVANPDEAPVNASEIKEIEDKPFDPNNLGAGVTFAPPSENGDDKKDEEDLSQYSNGDSQQPMLDPNLPNTNGVDTSSQTVRFNPVTGEEMDMRELRGEEIVTEPVQEKLKTVEVNPQAEKRANSIALIVFFVFLIAFVIFLPEIQVFFNTILHPSEETSKDITTGKLVCNIETTTADLDKDISKIFTFEDNKLKTGKFTTTIKGDAAAVDDDDLAKLTTQCEAIKANVEGLEGIEVKCTSEPSKLIQSESFDYTKYDAEKVGKAYLEADSSIMDYAADADIDQIMLQLRQGGYMCEKQA